MTFDVSATTPNSPVGFVYAFGLGSQTVVNPLTGNTLVTGLAATNFTIGSIVSADAFGNASFTTAVPAAAAGLVHCQAVDAVTNGLSNVVSL